MKIAYLAFLVSVASATPTDPNPINAVEGPASDMNQSAILKQMRELEGVVGGVLGSVGLEDKRQMDKRDVDCDKAVDSIPKWIVKIIKCGFGHKNSHPNADSEANRNRDPMVRPSHGHNL
ncbi:hypothetical protein TCAP_03017 [Tolypocladium capitatum]|uniref:Uncharacterized protein n=1 Tax=Tolypocladium capitatum TaxID=45235 RepID=A0A2K3QHP4_9HYPO|nr:hypothetical protein TCAP_03017 [Tolypocladium capitatum]